MSRGPTARLLRLRRLAGLLPVLLLLAAGACRHGPEENGDGGDAGTVDGGTDGGTDAGTEVSALCRTDDLTPPVSDNREGWWRDDVFYEIFVRSFQDSDGDGVGDLAGLTQRLDYLNDGDPDTDQDLGIEAVWLMPIFASPSYHGYDVTDYTAVNPDYGTLADFDAFVEAAHARGIRVILDFVLNHTSVQHPWFQSARQGEDSPTRDHYLWRDSDPGWTQPWSSAPVWHLANGDYYYGLFWRGMPDLNWENPEVLEAMVSAMRFWLDRGVDGFRIDAARHLVESDTGRLYDVPCSHTVIKRVRAALHEGHPEALLVAEAWSPGSIIGTYYGEADEFQLAFSFGLGAGILESVEDGLPVGLNQALTDVAGYTDPGFSAPFLTNHDQVRAMRVFGGDVAKARLAAAVLLALPGTPFLYYGEELGMQGESPAGGDADPAKRTPMRWTAEAPFHGFTDGAATWYSARFGTASDEVPGTNVADQQADPNSLWSTYRDLLALREASPALTAGTATKVGVPSGDAHKGLFALLRTPEAGPRVLFLANFADTPAPAFGLQVAGQPSVLYQSGLTGTPGGGDTLDVSGLDARSFVFLELQ